MPFQKGNKEGAKSQKQKPFSDALRIAVKRANAQGGTKLQDLAEKLVNEALSGNVQALKEIGDRLDGKPAQQINHADQNGDGPLTIEIVKFAGATPEQLDS